MRHEIIELGEKALLPAFGDGHIHFTNWALIHSTVDVRDATNFEELAEILKLAGITLKNAEVVQVGQALEQSQVQQEKMLLMLSRGQSEN